MLSLLSVLLVLALLFLSFFLLFSSKPTSTGDYPRGTIPLPGPRPIPIFGNLHQLWGKALHLRWLELAKQYGPIFQLRMGAKTLIIINDHKVAKDLFVSRCENYSNRPENKLFAIMTNNRKSMIFAPYANYWKTLRIIASQSLCQSITNPTYDPIIARQVRSFLRHIFDLSNKNAHGFDPTREISNAVIKTMASITYSYCPQDDDDLLLQSYLKIIRQYFLFWGLKGGILLMFPFLSVTPLATRLESKAWELRDKLESTSVKLYDHVVSRIAAKDVEAQKSFAAQTLKNCKIQSGLTTNVFTHVFEKDSVDGKYLISRDEILSMCNTAMITGTHTTIQTLRWMFAILAVYPDAQRKIQEELDRVLVDWYFPEGKHEAEMPYLKASIKECLRFRPVLPAMIPHETIHDDVYNGYSIPAKSTVILNTTPILYDPEIFENPEDFVPERYLDEKGKLKPADELRDPWVFGRGKRTCIGNSIAERNIFSFTSCVLSLFNIELATDLETGKEKTIDLRGKGSSFNWNVAKYEIKFVPREKVDVGRILDEEW